jgi:glycosyltransferase involved in cell wall biosynthesis
LGLTKNLNRALAISKGEYIARMDADDICHPSRFEKQVDILTNQINIIAVGSDIKIFGSEERYQKYPDNDLECRKSLLFRSCFAHPAVMMRRKLLIDNDIKYDPSYYTAEDYNMWIKLSDFGSFHNINEPLLQYRISDSSISVSRKEEQLKLKKELQLLAFEHFFKYKLDEKHAKVYISLLHPYSGNLVDWNLASDFLEQLVDCKLGLEELKKFLHNKICENALQSVIYNTNKGVKQLNGFVKFCRKANIPLPKEWLLKIYAKSMLKLNVKGKKDV